MFRINKGNDEYQISLSVIEGFCHKNNRTIIMKLKNNKLNGLFKIFKNGYYFANGYKCNLKCTYKQLTETMVLLPNHVNNIFNLFYTKDFRYENICKSGCYNCDSLMHTIRLKEQIGDNKVLLLNLANPFHPVTNVRQEKCTQEEELCKRSSLLCSLYSAEASKYYEYNQNSTNPNESTSMIISPYVEVVKNEEEQLLSDSKVVSVLTCAAPITNPTERSLKDYKTLVYSRILNMLACIAYFKYEYLVLGAWGCGAFGNDAKDISALFNKALYEEAINGIRLSKCFKRVDFAILDNSDNQYNYNCFKQYFSDNYNFENKL